MNILILEDEWLIAEALKDELEEMGHHVIGPANNCAAALEVLLRERPDLAVLDTRLGSETCEVVLEECQRQDIPVIITSGHARAELPAFAVGLPLLAKPHAPTGLAGLLSGFAAAAE